MNKYLSTVASIALGASLFAGSINAAPLTPNGSFSGYQIGTTVADGVLNGGSWQLGASTTSITVTDNHGISSTAASYLGSDNNLSTAFGGTVADGHLFFLSSNTFSVTTGILSTALTLTVDSYTFEFTQQKVTSQVNGNIGLYFFGNLINDLDPSDPLLTPASASFSVTFTQSAESGSIGTAYSLDTPPRVIPEPATLGLFGIGLLGFAASRRRKAA